MRLLKENVKFLLQCFVYCVGFLLVLSISFYLFTKNLDYSVIAPEKSVFFVSYQERLKEEEQLLKLNLEAPENFLGSLNIQEPKQDVDWVAITPDTKMQEDFFIMHYLAVKGIIKDKEILNTLEHITNSAVAHSNKIFPHKKDLFIVADRKVLDAFITFSNDSALYLNEFFLAANLTPEQEKLFRNSWEAFSAFIKEDVKDMPDIKEFYERYLPNLKDGEARDRYYQWEAWWNETKRVDRKNLKWGL